LACTAVEKVYFTLKPHVIDGGIVFRRTDLDVAVDVPSNALLVNETTMSSNLIKDGVKIGTVEHLMSALAGLGIDNALLKSARPKFLLWMVVQGLLYF
jgi:UDP-3-O-[3-hydroxymyristoyl] N-acetylglucosamine deacetylase